MSELIIQRTIMQTIDSYGATRNLDGPTKYFLDGNEIDKSDATAWLQGQALSRKSEPKPIVQPVEPGLHHYNDAIPADAPSVWVLLPGYPLDAASKIAQISADTTGQPQYIIQDITNWVVNPNPNSPSRHY